MKKAKEFFGIFLSIIVCVLVISAITYATTTISSDITVEDDLTVTDDLIVNGLASVSETLRVPTLYGNTDSGLYLRVGDQALASHNLNAQDDLLITGDLEADGTSFFDGTVSVSSNGLLLDDGATITSGAASIAGDCTIGSIYLRTGTASMGAAFSVCDATNTWTSLGESDL